MPALVTGAAGFIGSHLAAALLAAGRAVRLVDAYTPYYDPELKRARAAGLARLFPGEEVIEADLGRADLAGLLRDVDVVFHLAAQPGVRASWGEGFGDYIRHNVSATQRLLEAARSADVRRIVYASSSSVYGDAERHPTPESARPAPISPYGVTKLAGEHLVLAYGRTFGIPVVALRYFTVYGPGQRPDMAFHRFIRAAAAGRPIHVFGDGEQSRDVTFVGDAVAATVAASDAPDVAGRAINVGGGSVVTVNRSIEVLERIAGAPLAVLSEPAEPGDARRTSADLTLARSLLGYAPTTGLEEGLQAEWDWLTGSAPAMAGP